MKTDTESAHVTPAGGNIFSDLGFEHEEAAALMVMSDRIISAKLAIRCALIRELADWIRVENLSGDEAARVLGVSASRISEVISLTDPSITIDALVSMVLRTGRRIEVSVGQFGRRRRQ